jgi:uncharacterized protein
MLGDLYRKGVPDALKPDPAEALHLFSRASALGFGDAGGNLGVMYINGEGTPKDVPKAVGLFKDGAEKDGNALCMYFYAMCLEGGIGVDKDEAAAQGWYTRAAEGGNATAAAWCVQHGVPFLPPH